MKYIKSLALLIAFLVLSSCGTAKINRHLSLNKIIEIKSLVQVISQYDIEHCIGEECRSFQMRSTSTGSVIGQSKTGLYILTTGHSCDPKFGIPFGLKNIYIKQHNLVVDSRLKAHKTTVVDFDSDLDICVLHSETLRAPKVKINKTRAPVQGDKVYNYAASYGVFGKRTIPILEGRYSGTMWGYSLYTIPAIGGSSGSPIFDVDGRLVGMIHSVHSRFHHLSFSVPHDKLLEFIDDNTPVLAPLGLRTEWTDIPGRKHKKIYIDETELKQYLKKLKNCGCKGKECFTKTSCNIK